jgi:hypothetical protein
MKHLLLLTGIIASSAATAQFTPDVSVNTPVCTYEGKQADPRLANAPDGYTYIAWKDWRNNGVPDIAIQKVSPSGNIEWTYNGINLCTEPADQSTPSITVDQQGGAIVAWSDWRSGIERDIYAQRINANGVIQWQYNGAIVTNKNNREHNEKIATDEHNGAFIAWEEQSGGNWNIWLQHLDSNGNRLLGNGGMPISVIQNPGINVRLQPDKDGGVFVTWQQQDGLGNYDIFAQRISYGGTRLWGPNGVQVTNAANSQTNPKIDPDPSVGGIFITWIDGRNSIDKDIYASRIDSSANLLWGINGKPVVSITGNQSAFDVASNNNINGLIVTWKDDRLGNGNADIYAQKIDKSGNPVWTLNGIPVCSSLFDQVNPSITGDKNKGVLIVWEDRAQLNNYNISGQRLDSNGNAYWASNGIPICTATGDQMGPKNTTDGDDGMIVVWEDERISTDRNIYMQRIMGFGDYYPAALNSTAIVNAHNIYPNPSTGIFYITDASKAVLRNMLGQVIPTTQYKQGNTLVMQINGQPIAGVYTVQAYISNGSIAKYNIVIH